MLQGRSAGFMFDAGIWKMLRRCLLIGTAKSTYYAVDTPPALAQAEPGDSWFDEFAYHSMVAHAAPEAISPQAFGSPKRAKFPGVPRYFSQQTKAVLWFGA